MSSLDDGQVPTFPQLPSALTKLIPHEPSTVIRDKNRIVV